MFFYIKSAYGGLIPVHELNLIKNGRNNGSYVAKQRYYCASEPFLCCAISAPQKAITTFHRNGSNSEEHFVQILTQSGRLLWIRQVEYESLQMARSSHRLGCMPVLLK